MLKISNARVIDPSQQLDQVQDLYIDNGRIAAPDPAAVSATLDASGLIIAPGFIDLSAAVREPGQTHKATIASETAAAVSGGITTLITPPTTHPVVDSPAVAELIIDRANASALARILPTGALTQGLAGEQLAPMHALHRSGCIAFSNARAPIDSAQVLLRCLEYAATYDFLVIFKPQNAALSAQGCVHDGMTCTRLGLTGIPETAETIELARCLLLVEQTGVRAHFGQLSCERSVQMIIEARRRGLQVSADVAIHQLLLTDECVDGFNSQFHLIPPLRSQLDRAGLRHALVTDGIQAICSDHQPHDAAAKQAPFPATEPGITGLQTLLPLGLLLVREELLSLAQLIDKLSCTPARILGLESGQLQPGAVADLCIFDPELTWQLTPANCTSAGHNSPFMGQQLTGAVIHTFVDGRHVYQRQPD